jgi:hypothetical protein
MRNVSYANIPNADLSPQFSPPQSRVSAFDNLLAVTEAMSLLGYTNRGAFMRMVRRQGLPRCRINKRVVRFDRVALHIWVGKRSIR